MRFKRATAMFTAFLLVLPTVPVSAEDNGKTEPETGGSYSKKHEVVYTTLDASGDQEEMYVVNNFTIEETGKIVDYGPYTSVQNLTDVTEIEHQEERVEMTAKEEEYYYQGNLEGKPLPWNINISYVLDGESMKPEELVGKDGKLKVSVDTTKNEKADESFFNNYLMQITMKLDSMIYENIQAPEGTIANAGKDRQVTFTVMPEKEGSFTMTADVTDLEMESIEFAAIPSSMSIDAPDIGGMRNDMGSLSNATAEINNGVGELKNGIAELNDGVANLYNGSEQFKSGIQGLSNGSSELVEGSASIHNALQQMNEAVASGSGDVNVSDITKMEDGLRQLSTGLNEVEKGLTNLKEQYGQAHQALTQSIEAIPEYQISEREIQALRESGANPEVVNKLIETYQAAQTAKGTFANVKEAYQAVGPALEQSAGSLNEMSTNLNTVADQIGTSMENLDIGESVEQLQEGLQSLLSKYGEFHSGLKEYTGGVDQLAGSYADIHSGIGGLTNGTSELENGATELHEGTSELASSTSDLPGQMDSEIEQMVEEYDKSDFEPTSFVSEKNKKVGSVQFVIKTESIKKDEEQEEAPKKEEEKSFWDRLLDLFR
ncbi:YhgE/Pip domain-containing protein [Halobacillus litoralis]|uniref:YhgE/Pip domain-containing protein n=1 Tax=Halobacillus litoralis TaxID=45668 RepID=A0A845E8I0_9BACI|nr:YhgE/Pip domain-containing protein [Halobacillus litoralis]MYL50456.1 YhgE/Pip domain-containing protein [Halobacillus litoralis]